MNNMNPPIFRAIGMISGTSIDGIDTALIETDGADIVRPLAFLPHGYDAAFRERLRACFGKLEGNKDPAIAAFERELTELHAAQVEILLHNHNIKPEHIDIIGFHGQTIWHKPEERSTIQLGDGALLANLTGIPVVNDFRSADVKAGGHGAPLVPLYHRALAASLPKPVAIINIGGVSNITWIGGARDDEIIAFDMGPGNALIDDWVLHHNGQPYDEYGALAASGCVDEGLVARFMAHPFFAEKPPKSLDRDAFRDLAPDELSPADGAATLTMMTARAIAEGLRLVPQPPLHVYLTGGGRHNRTMMRWIGELSGLPVGSVDELGWSGDGLEAEAFAYLAVRSRLGLPLTLPGTTGVLQAMTGGRYYPASASCTGR
jgi:anhydro-N-acetylmuramic acid kinase